MKLFKFKENSIFTKRGRIKRDIDRFNKCIKMCDETIEIFSNLKIRTIDELREEKEAAKLAKKEERIAKRAAKKIEKNIDVVDEFDQISNENINMLNSITEDIKQVNEDLTESIGTTEAILNNISHPATINTNNSNGLKKNIVHIDITNENASSRIIHNRKEVQVSLIRNIDYRKIVSNAVKGNDAIAFMHNLSQSGVVYEDMGSGAYDITNPKMDSCFTLDLTDEKEPKLNTVSIHPTLMIAPHGKKEAIFDRLLKELGIKKCAPYDYGKQGTMTFIELDDESVAACNMILTGKELSVIIMYLDEETINEFKELDGLSNDEDNDE